MTTNLEKRLDEVVIVDRQGSKTEQDYKDYVARLTLKYANKISDLGKAILLLIPEYTKYNNLQENGINIMIGYAINCQPYYAVVNNIGVDCLNMGELGLDKDKKIDTIRYMRDFYFSFNKFIMTRQEISEIAENQFKDKRMGSKKKSKKIEKINIMSDIKTGINERKEPYYSIAINLEFEYDAFFSKKKYTYIIPVASDNMVAVPNIIANALDVDSPGFRVTKHQAGEDNRLILLNRPVVDLDIARKIVTYDISNTGTDAPIGLVPLHAMQKFKEFLKGKTQRRSYLEDK